MALAVGYGHIGFGLAFLNFIGTILFFVFFLVMLKFLFGRMRYSDSADWGGRSWRKRAYKRYRSWSEDDEGVPVAPAKPDEALKLARERLAKSEFSPKDFEAVKDALLNSQPNAQQARDEAFTTARTRLAKGELSVKEFDAVIKALS